MSAEAPTPAVAVQPTSQASQPASARRRWQRAGDALARILLALAALSLGVVLAVSAFASVWLMVGADDGNLTQSMSVFTWLAPSSWPVLLAGLAGAGLVAGLLWLARRHGSFLDGPGGVRALVLGSLAFQLAMIVALDAREAWWGDSWMVADFVNEALSGGIPSIFEGPYKGLFYDARLYFSCYPFQATLFWLFYGLRLAFGGYCCLAFQLLSALANCLGAASLLSLGRSLGLSSGGRRLLWALVALCLPMWWLATFLYGNAMGCGLALAFLALQARAMRERGRRGLLWGALSFVPLALALCVKATFVLFAIAAVLAQAVFAVRRREARGIACCLVALALARLVSGLPFEALRAASGGYEFGDALTTLNHLELGLRQGWGEFYLSVDGGELEYAPGGWSNHANAVWSASGQDAEEQNRMAAQNLLEDLAAFAADPAYALRFFSLKLASEWADPTYQSLFYLSMCGRANGTRANPADLTTPLGLVCTVLTFLLDGYQTLVFAGALACVLAVRRRWCDGPNPAALLLAAAFFTGFGCYLLWEAKSVYVLPFAICALPLSAAGIDAVLARLPWRIFRMESAEPSRRNIVAT